MMIDHSSSGDGVVLRCCSILLLYYYTLPTKYNFIPCLEARVV